MIQDGNEGAGFVYSCCCLFYLLPDSVHDSSLCKVTTPLNNAGVANFALIKSEFARKLRLYDAFAKQSLRLKLMPVQTRNF